MVVLVIGIVIIVAKSGIFQSKAQVLGTIKYTQTMMEKWLTTELSAEDNIFECCDAILKTSL